MVFFTCFLSIGTFTLTSNYKTNYKSALVVYTYQNSFRVASCHSRTVGNFSGIVSGCTVHIKGSFSRFLFIKYFTPSCYYYMKCEISKSHFISYFPQLVLGFSQSLVKRKMCTWVQFPTLKLLAN